MQESHPNFLPIELKAAPDLLWSCLESFISFHLILSLFFPAGPVYFLVPALTSPLPGGIEGIILSELGFRMSPWSAEVWKTDFLALNSP